MGWSTENVLRLLAAIFCAALLVAACGGEETALAPDDEQGPNERDDGPVDGPGNGPGNTSDPQQSEDGGPDESTEDEAALLNIVANAEGSGADPDNRTGAPPGAPSTYCPPPSDTLEVIATQSANFNGITRPRSAAACVEYGDLWLVTVTDPNGDVRDQSWTQSLYQLEVAPSAPVGRYETAASPRRGGTMQGGTV